MVRTLLLTTDRASLDLTLTVLDNRSDDEHRAALTSYLHTQNIPLLQTSFDATVAVEKHGAALENFVQQHDDCTHYLFLDADIWFVGQGTLRSMLDELMEAGSGIFANQARIAGYYAGHIIEGVGGTSKGITFTERADIPIYFGDRQYAQRVASRCSPVCSLVTNTPLFRHVVERVGLTPAVRFGVNTAAYYDTFSLMTHVMATHGQNFMISSKTINHFTQSTYVAEHRAVKDRDCLTMLEELRAGHGIEQDIFFESEWIRQQRRDQPA